jgi:hypothetical protein
MIVVFAAANDVLAVVLLSVMASAPVELPTVNTAVAAVSEVTLMLAIEAPVPPATENNVLAVS